MKFGVVWATVKNTHGSGNRFHIPGFLSVSTQGSSLVVEKPDHVSEINFLNNPPIKNYFLQSQTHTCTRCVAGILGSFMAWQCWA